MMKSQCECRRQIRKEGRDDHITAESRGGDTRI